MAKTIAADAKSQPRRSTDAADYQTLPRPMAAMARGFPDRHEIAPHRHERDQLVYALSGVMRVRTESEAWIVPPDRAVYLRAGTEHAIGMRGQVEMRTLYIAPEARRDLPPAPCVFEVSALLRELILAMLQEPVIYDENGRAGAIVSLIFDEIARAKPLSLVIPMPHDVRLLRLCETLLDDPATSLTFEQWSETAGASPRTLARLFESELGMSFGVWRQRVRFYNALESIVQGQPIGRIAARNGYRSPSAFAAAFRKSMGISPSRLRM